MVTVVVEFTYVCRERDWWLFKGVLFFVREIKGNAVDQEISLCGEFFVWRLSNEMEHMRICSTSLKMLNRIYPLMGVVNCAFGSLRLASRCTIVKFLQPIKILGDASLQEETWWLLSADASLTPGEKHACLIGTCTYHCRHSTRILRQGSWIAKTLNCSGRVGVMMPGSAYLLWCIWTDHKDLSF